MGGERLREQGALDVQVDVARGQGRVLYGVEGVPGQCRAGLSPGQLHHGRRRRPRLAIEGIAADAYGNHTMGCPFIKATGEFPDPENPIRRVVTRHRAWFHQDLHDMPAAAGRDDSATKADALGMLRDSLLVGSFLDDKDKARRTFVRTARWIAGLD